MNQLAISLAYKYVAVALMLAEANFCSEKLHLKARLPIAQSQIQQVYVAPPRLLKSLGSIDTAQYSYGFSEAGRLRYITKLHPFGDQPVAQLQRRLAKIDSNMSTNAAYQLATNWLVAVSVDLKDLERKFPGTVRQHFYHSSGGKTVLLPIFDVLWGSADNPAVIVTIYGPTAELLQLRQNNESFSKRPPRSLNNIEALLAIPDAEFSQYTAAQRAGLLPIENRPRDAGSAATDSAVHGHSEPQPMASHDAPFHLAQQIATSDRIVCTNFLRAGGDPKISLTVSGKKVKQVVKAISSAKRLQMGTDSVWDWQLLFYAGTKPVAMARFQDKVFLAENGEFADETGVLEKLYKDALGTLSNKREEEAAHR